MHTKKMTLTEEELQNVFQTLVKLLEDLDGDATAQQAVIDIQEVGHYSEFSYVVFTLDRVMPIIYKKKTMFLVV